MNFRRGEGLGDLDNDLVSIVKFTGVDSLSSEHSSTSTPWASISMIASLELVPSPLSSFATFVMASSITTLLDSITVFVFLLKTLYAGLVVEYSINIPSSLFASNFPRFSQSFRM